MYISWGVEVFLTENDKNVPDLDCSDCFKGSSNGGKTLTPGTYFYLLKGDYNLLISGFITIIGN